MAPDVAAIFGSFRDGGLTAWVWQQPKPLFMVRSEPSRLGGACCIGLDPDLHLCGSDVLIGGLGYEDGTAARWELDKMAGTLKIGPSWHAHAPAPIACAPYSGVASMAIDGEVSITGGSDGNAFIWQCPEAGETITHRMIHAAHGGAVTGVALAGHWAVTAGEDGDVRIWSQDKDVTLPRIGADTHGRPTPVSALVLDAGVNRLCAGSLGGFVQLWDVSARRAVRRFVHPAHRRRHTTGVESGRCQPELPAVQAVAFDTGDQPNNLVSGASDGTLRLWDARAAEAVEHIQAHRTWVATVGLCSERLLSATCDGHAVLRDLRNLNAPLETLDLLDRTPPPPSGADDTIRAPGVETPRAVGA
eukprot:NODE_7069_length_1612_cov_8.206061.p1 GENE.NODE_7069_length_1612_cov_8.206061~~NODE_7069_length_1612_cov_8.206061.p1  ORF type:complete len:360 (+),score=81.48 NODE_7069_length_1612_cov_8.206061:326-1405(+)